MVFRPVIRKEVVQNNDKKKETEEQENFVSPIQKQDKTVLRVAVQSLDGKYKKRLWMS